MKISEKDFKAAVAASKNEWGWGVHRDCLRAAIDAIPEPAPVACGDDVREAVARVVFGFALPAYTWEADTAVGHKTWLKRADAVLAVILPRLCPACVEKLAVKPRTKTLEELIQEIIAAHLGHQGTEHSVVASMAANIVAVLKKDAATVAYEEARRDR